MYTIYKIINRNNGKVYIGRTKQLRRRMAEHRSQYNRPDRTNNSPLYIAMREEGIDNFYHEIIEETDDFEKSCELEKYYIQYYRERLGRDNVYNYQDGGVGGQSHNVDGKNNPMYGKHLTEEQKKKISISSKGKKKPEGFGDKISKALKGKPKNKEAVAKRCVPVSLINIYTQEIRNFPSRAEAGRQLHCDISYLLKKGKAKDGWKIYKKD